MAGEIKSYSLMRKDFYEKYRKKIVPTVRKYEKERKSELMQVILLSGMAVIAGSLFLIAFFFNTGTSALMKLCIMCYTGAFLIWYLAKKDFENKIKSKIMPSVCECFGDMDWEHGKYSGSLVFSMSGLIPYFTDEEYDDVFKGSFKGVNIDIVEPEYAIGKGRNRNVVFNGVIVKLDMNKTFEGHTLIKPNKLLHSSPVSTLRHTNLEDVEFNKKFDVFTNNEVEARYLITPAFMERLKRMRIAFGANNVSCVFFRDKLIIALPTNKDIFSICSLVKPIDDKKQYFQMYEEIVSIIKLIDHFKLDQRTGL